MYVLRLRMPTRQLHAARIDVDPHGRPPGGARTGEEDAVATGGIEETSPRVHALDGERQREIGNRGWGEDLSQLGAVEAEHEIHFRMQTVICRQISIR